MINFFWPITVILPAVLECLLMYINCLRVNMIADIDQSTNTTSRHCRDMTSDVSKRR